MLGARQHSEPFTNNNSFKLVSLKVIFGCQLGFVAGSFVKEGSLDQTQSSMLQVVKDVAMRTHCV